MKRILCIDDEPCRYDRFYPMALERGFEVVITDDPTMVKLYLAHHPSTEIAGVCLDHDMPHGDGVRFAREFLIERSLPVAIVSSNEVGRKRIQFVLDEYEVPCTQIPAVLTGWEEKVFTYFGLAPRPSP